MQLKSQSRYQRPSRRRAEIERSARVLLAEHGNGAGRAARTLSRLHRLRGALPNAFWQAVARRIGSLKAS